MVLILGGNVETYAHEISDLFKAGLLDYRTTKFENDANRPSCFQQLQAVIYHKSHISICCRPDEVFDNKYKIYRKRADVILTIQRSDGFGTDHNKRVLWKVHFF